MLGDEVNPSLNVGALYFGEAMYIAADDAAAGNSHNNASYRRMRFNQNANLTPTFLFPGVTPAPTTQRSKPAIQAWSDYGGGTDANGQPIADANACVRAIDVPGDGRMWVAHKIVDNGNGTWRYEYAVMNMTSDRSGASFTVPIAPGRSSPTRASATSRPFRRAVQLGRLDVHRGRDRRVVDVRGDLCAEPQRQRAPLGDDVQLLV